MKIVSVERSSEDCQQAGWLAVDVSFSCPVTREQILSWGELGDLVYLQTLRTPFFRIAANNFMIKGLEGKSRLRIGFQQGFFPVCDTEALAGFLFPRDP